MLLVPRRRSRPRVDTRGFVALGDQKNRRRPARPPKCSKPRTPSAIEMLPSGDEQARRRRRPETSLRLPRTTRSVRDKCPDSAARASPRGARSVRSECRRASTRRGTPYPSRSAEKWPRFAAQPRLIARAAVRPSRALTIRDRRARRLRSAFPRAVRPSLPAASVACRSASARASTRAGTCAHARGAGAQLGWAPGAPRGASRQSPFRQAQLATRC